MFPKSGLQSLKPRHRIYFLPAEISCCCTIGSMRRAEGGRRVGLVGVVSLQWCLFVLPPHFTLIDPQSPSLPPFLHPHLAVIARLSCLFLSSSRFTSRRDCAGAPPSKTNTPTPGEVVSDSASQDLHFLPYWLPQRLPASNLAQLHKKIVQEVDPRSNEGGGEVTKSKQRVDGGR